MKGFIMKRINEVQNDLRKTLKSFDPMVIGNVQLSEKQIEKIVKKASKDKEVYDATIILIDHTNRNEASDMYNNIVQGELILLASMEASKRK